MVLEFQGRLLLAEWAPTGNAIVFVANDRNIYYKPSVSSDPIAVTTDGSPVIYNGVCDWVYEGMNSSQLLLHHISN